MRPLAKVGYVALGYVAAFVAAWLVVMVYILLTNTPARQASSGMAAFGDFLLFLGLFGVASIPSTIAALVFLRPYATFWRVLSVASLVIAATGIAAALAYTVPAAPLRLVVAPLFAMFFTLSGVIAPDRSDRLRLFCAVAVEIAGFAFFAFDLFIRRA
jgi:hypothetical protein